MLIPNVVRRMLLDRLMRVALTRDPDFTIVEKGHIYLRRWFIIPRNKYFNIYFHHFCHSDDARSEHSHPWAWNASVLLEGGYIEHSRGNVYQRPQGTLTFRKGTSFHRIELPNEKPVWTLFITGSKDREWGFDCPNKFVHWKDFTKPDGHGGTMGCGE